MYRVGYLCLCLGFMGSGYGQGNLIANGGFERGLDGWKVRFPEKNETKYSRNHEWVKVVDAPGRAGKKAVEFVSEGKVAASEGVKCVTKLIKIERGQAYEFGADVFHSGTGCKMFLEGYREDKEQLEKGSDQYAGYVRCYRASIHVKTKKGEWGTARRVILPPKRYQPDFLLLKLYCYYPPGKVYYTNVFLRKTSEQPGKTYRPIRKSKKKPKSTETTE